MKKRIIIIFAVVIIGIMAGAAYVYRLVLSPKMKDMITGGMEQSTGKKVIIGSLDFNIFKGLIIKDLIIYDKNTAIINAKEASCVFLIQPLFNKQIIIPSITFRSPEIYIERRPDNSLNLAELFMQQDIPKDRYKVVVRRICIRSADLILHDDALEDPFKKEIKGVDIDVFLSLPASVRFKSNIPLAVKGPAGIIISGEYRVMEKELRTEIEIKDLEPKEFGPYYETFGFHLPEGRVDLKGSVNYKDGLLDADIDGRTDAIVYSKDNLTATLDSDMEVGIGYNFKDKSLSYSGNINVQNMKISGVEAIDKVEDITGDFLFDNSGLSCDNLSARTLGLAVNGKLYVADLADPLMDIEVTADTKLEELEKILNNSFRIRLPMAIGGEGKLFVSLQYNPLTPGQCQISGHLDTSGARVIIDKSSPALEDVTGRVQYTANQLSWVGLKFKRVLTQYETSGIITNFDTPGVQLSLSSQDLELDAIFGAGGKTLNFSKFKGRYLNSVFSLEGRIDMSGAGMPADISGTIDFNLADLKKVFPESADKFDRTKLKGTVHAGFSLLGNLKDPKNCSVDAKLSSDSFTIYDLKPSRVALNYRQNAGEAEIPFMHAILYGGTLDLSARIGLSAKDMPYSVNADISGVKIEKLKTDTAFKDKEISGSIKTKIKLNGYSGYLSRLSGEGRLDITDGKLWQLNLFKGLGVLLFTSDFSNVIFKEGSCDFIVRDKKVYTNNLELKSGLVDMYGPVKIGFDNTIDSTLKAEVTMEALEAKSAKTVTVAMGRYTYIEITGTLKDPKYRIRPDVPSMVEDLTEAIFNR